MAANQLYLAAGLLAAILTCDCGDGSRGDPGYDDSPGDDPTAPAYTVEIAVTSAARIGALQFEINHLGDSGGFIGRGDQIDCTPKVDAFVAGNYVGERTAKVALISVEGIRTPAAIVDCGFRTREDLDADDFLIEVTDASDTDSAEIDPAPTVAVSAVIPR